MVTNTIEEAIIGNNHKFAKDYEAIHAHINRKGSDHTILKKQVMELKGIIHLQKTIINSCHDQTAALEETVKQLVKAVRKLKGTICHCHDWLMLPGPHYVEGEQEEAVVDLEEEDDNEEDGLEYKTEEEPLDPSCTTPPSTGG